MQATEEPGARRGPCLPAGLRYRPHQLAILSDSHPVTGRQQLLRCCIQFFRETTAAEPSMACHAGCEPEPQDHLGDDLNSIGSRAADIVHATRQRSHLPEVNLGLRACQGEALPADLLCMP